MSIICNLQDIVFMISFQFLSILVTSFSVGAEMIMYFLVFTPKQVNCPSNSSANSFMIKMIIMVRSTVKSYGDFFCCTLFKTRYAMCSACIMTMIPILTKFFIFSMFPFKYFITNITKFCIFYDFYCWFVNNLFFSFLKLIISIVCSLKDLQNFFIQSLSLYTSCLFCMLLNDDIVS